MISCSTIIKRVLVPSRTHVFRVLLHLNRASLPVIVADKVVAVKTKAEAHTREWGRVAASATPSPAPRRGPSLSDSGSSDTRNHIDYKQLTSEQCQSTVGL